MVYIFHAWDYLAVADGEYEFHIHHIVGCGEWVCCEVCGKKYEMPHSRKFDHELGQTLMEHAREARVGACA
jgi:hypothetical protein